MTLPKILLSFSLRKPSSCSRSSFPMSIARVLERSASVRKGDVLVE